MQELKQKRVSHTPYWVSVFSTFTLGNESILVPLTSIFFFVFVTLIEKRRKAVYCKKTKHVILR